MAIDRKLAQESFIEWPLWPCPACFDGRLILQRDTLKTLEHGSSRKAHTHEAWDLSWIRKEFIALLQCNLARCAEVISVSGELRVGEDDEGPPYDIFEPRFFSQGPPIFPIHTTYPDPIQILTKEAFFLFWIDTKSSANRIRATIEEILTDKSIQIAVSKLKLGTRLPLHARIQLFKKKNAEAGELLEAIKWIGNAGSHANDADLDREALLDAFDILEHVLELLYVRKTAHIKRLARKITERKGRPIARRAKPAF